MTDKNIKITRTVINYIVAVITAMFIFLFGACLALGIATSKGYIKFTVKSTDYIENSSAELKERLISLAIPSGLPESFFDNKIDSATLLKLNNECIDNAYTKGTFSVDTNELKQDLVNDFKDYAASGALASDVDVTDEALNYLADLCAEKYEKTAANSVFKYLSYYAGKLGRYTPFAIIGTFLFSVFGICFMMKLCKNAPDKRFMYFALCGGGLMMAAAPTVILIGGFVNKISIAARSMHLFVSAYVNNLLLFMSLFGLLIIGIAIFVLIFKKKDKKSLDLK